MTGVLDDGHRSCSREPAATKRTAIEGDALARRKALIPPSTTPSFISGGKIRRPPLF
jgi:hypothetical protein